MYIETMGWGTNGASSCTRVTEVLHESQSDRLIGMVTDRDIVCKGLAQDNFDAGRATARDVMTPGIHCCRDDDDLAKARPTHGGAEGPQIAGDQ